MTQTDQTPGQEDVTRSHDRTPRDRPQIPLGRKALYAACIVLAILAGLELVGQLFFATKADADSYLRQAYYRDRDWSREYFDAQDRLKLRYEPYVGWRRTDCRTKYLNVIHGERLTVHPSDPSPAAVEIWCFGGSTMWGTGVRDAHTIPSELVRIATRAGYDVRVRNLGESGWVSTQEVLCLNLKLRDGDRPDIALFYDGINDVFATYQSGRTDGAHQNLSVFEDYFNRGVDSRRRLRHKIALYRLFKKISRRFTPQWRSSVVDDASADVIAAQLVDTYRRTVEWARNIGRADGVDTAFFWQPMIVYQPDYQNSERDAYRRGRRKGTEGMLDFYRTTTQDARELDIIDLSQCLGPSPPEGYFIDHNHLNESGNAVVARAIFAHIRPLIEQRRRRTEPDSNPDVDNPTPHRDR